MRRLFSRIVGSTGGILLNTSAKLAVAPALDAQAEIFAAWFRDEGDKTLRVDYDLLENSVVFDLGGYEGQWASDIFSRYRCLIHVFEPIEHFAEAIKQRFSRNSSIIVHDFGLSGKTEKLRISVDDDASSIHKKGRNEQEVMMVSALEFFDNNRIEKIDLMKINIEGCEYDLLEHILDSGFVENIDNIQVQFHDFVPSAKERMTAIQQRLQRTHELTYQYPFCWENWKRLNGG
jgi:FkbM family methyltransferase